MRSRVPFAILALALVVGAGLHAWHGIGANIRMEFAGDAEDEDRWDEAAAAFRDAAVLGMHQARARREAAELALEKWEAQVDTGGHLAGDPALLRIARDDYLLGLCAAPASRYAWGGMSEIYEYIEWVDRERRALDASKPIGDGDPWAEIGRPGRVSVGLARLAIERAPNWYALEDAMVRRLWDFGAREAALEAVARAARLLPIFSRHRFGSDRATEPEILTAFAESSWQAIGSTPLAHPVDHLIDLGKVEYDRGEFERSIEALNQALEAGGDAINRAETHYRLGLSLMRLDRMGEAASNLIEASKHPSLEAVALINIATIAEQAGESERALQALRRLRRLDPKNVEYCLRFAESARRLARWPAALEALRWARLHHAADPRVLRALGEVQIDSGDLTGARATYADLKRLEPDGPETLRLIRAIEDATTPRAAP